jgi:cell division initiation protein
MTDFDTQEFRAARFSRSASDQLADRTFPVVMRGYDRAAVDAFVQEVVELVRELEGSAMHESVVQRKLEEVGEETAGILQRAHETADEIAARSRAQAEGRIQRAEREADLTRQQADAYAEQVVVDTRLLWEERQRLIEDLRTLAEDVLNTAEDAAERVALPEMLGDDEEADPGLAAEPGIAAEPETDPGSDGAPEDQPTGEVELDVLQGGAAEDDDTTSNGSR